jgi:hypothetical protein
MRSEVIFRAKEIIANRYALCQTVSKATRQLHVSSRNTQETINHAFAKIAVSSKFPVLSDAVNPAGAVS